MVKRASTKKTNIGQQIVALKIKDLATWTPRRKD
jgi:hypothetical protein